MKCKCVQPCECHLASEVKAQPNPVGRPLERPGARKISAKLDADKAFKLDRIAAARGVKPHALACVALVEWLDQQTDPDPNPAQLLIPLNPREDVFVCPQCGFDKASKTQWHNCY